MTTGSVSDEMLMAYADGELDENQAADVKRAVAGNPALQTKLAEFEATRLLARESFAGIKARPVPPELVRSVLAHAPSRPGRWRQPAMSRLIPLAASIALMAGALGYLAGSYRDAGPSLLGADHAITAALEASDSGAVTDADHGRRINVLATYRVQDRLCRTFVVSSSREAVKGLACRASSQWTVELAVTQPVAGSSTYAPASDQSTPSIDAFLDSAGAGEPLDEKAEAQYRKQNWRLGR